MSTTESRSIPDVVHRRGQQRVQARLNTSPRRVYEVVRAAIRSGFVGYDHHIDEADLVKNHATSRNAVRQALQMLAREGIIERSPRRGTSVHAAMVRMALDPRDPLQRIPVAPERAVEPFTARLLDVSVVPSTPYIRQRMDIAASHLRAYEHLVSLNGEPIQVRFGYVPLEFDVPDVLAHERNRATAFEQRFGVPFGRSEDAIEAVPCDARTSKLLEIEPASPVLLRETLLIDATGRACELSFRYNRGDRVSLCAHSGDC